MHVCPPGCCNDEAAGDPEKSKARALALVDKVLLPSVMVPAANKWTKVEPVISRVTLWANFHNLMKEAFNDVVFQQARQDPESDISEGEQVGAPPGRAEGVQQNVRQTRAEGFCLPVGPGLPCVAPGLVCGE